MDKIGLGVILGAFIAILVGLAIYNGGVTSNIGAATRTIATNQSITSPAAGATTELIGQNIVGTPIVVNATGGETLEQANNYSVYQAIGTDGLIAVIYKSNTSKYAATAINISYTYEPDGYVSDAGGRSVTLLIPIMVALLIAIIALPKIKGIFD